MAPAVAERRSVSRRGGAGGGGSPVWVPQPGSQVLFLSCPVYEALYTGTRGPGKTDALLMDFAQHCERGHGEAWRGILFRHEYKPLQEVVAKSKRWFHKIFPGRVRFLESKGDYKWVWESGEELMFRAVKRKEDYWDYHGFEIPWIGWEELTAWPEPAVYHVFKSINRSSHPDVPRKYRATCNPYGPGHNWVKSYFIDPAPAGQPFVPDPGQLEHALGEELTAELDDMDTGLRAVTLHGHYSENRALMDAEPDYPAKIRAAASNPAQAKAWLTDDWDIVAGGMFDDVWDREVHVIEGWEPAETPRSWRIDRAMDWGSSKPFAVGWWAESDGTEAPNGEIYPRGTVLLIAEWYGWNGTPNEGLRLTDREIARGIVEREKDMDIHGRVKAGPADVPTERPGQSSMEAVFRAAGVSFTEPDKRSGSRESGWAAMRRMMKESLKERPEEPCLYVFERCRQFIRTVPTLPRDERDPDDVDTEAEDHIADMTRYRITTPPRRAEGVDFRV